MKAVTVVPRRPGTLEVMDVPEPAPGKDQLLLKVERVGVCGTDRDIIGGFYGEAPEGSPYLILGHESLCTVMEPGQEAQGFERGDLVVPTVRRDCPEECLNCRSGESDMCLTGHYREHGIRGLHGFASEVTVSDRRFVARLPRELTDVGVLLEPLTIVEKGVLQAYAMQSARMKWEPSKALVLGSGPVGLLATALLRLRGLDVDTVARKPPGSAKARLASSLGGRYVDAKETPLASLGAGYDLVVEATGSTDVALEAQGHAGVNGVVSLLGIYPGKVETQDAGKALSDLVLGNRIQFGSVNANISYFRRGTEDLVSIRKRWPGFLTQMITERVPLGEASSAYEQKGDDHVKTVIEI